MINARVSTKNSSSEEKKESVFGCSNQRYKGSSFGGLIPPTSDDNMLLTRQRRNK